MVPSNSWGQRIPSFHIDGGCVCIEQRHSNTPGQKDNLPWPTGPHGAPFCWWYHLIHVMI